MLFAKRPSRAALYVPVALLVPGVSLVAWYTKELVRAHSTGSSVAVSSLLLLSLGFLLFAVDSIRWVPATAGKEAHLRTPFRRVALPINSSFRVARTLARGGWSHHIEIGCGGQWYAFAYCWSERGAHRANVALTRWRLSNARHIETTPRFAGDPR
jgi:hypothetical protein